MIKNIHKGDHIACMGEVVTVGKILYRDYYAGTWDVEFIDTEGNYRHWKQALDGGKLIRTKKKLIDWYGIDVTDIFLKYGQPL